MSTFEKINSELMLSEQKEKSITLKDPFLDLKTLDEHLLPDVVEEVVLVSVKPIDLVIWLRTTSKHINYLIKAHTTGRIVFYLDEEEVNVTRTIVLEDNTDITFVCPDFNQGHRLLNIETKLNGTNAKSDWNLATYASKSFKKTFNISFSHYGDGSVADMKNYGVILDKSKLVFSGNSTIFENVKGCETHQTARIIVFDQGGVAQAEPNLNIYHNDVIAASHAATVGKINADHLYYLNTRGIDDLMAKRLITKGYLQPIMNYIEDDELKAKLLRQLEEVL